MSKSDDQKLLARAVAEPITYTKQGELFLIELKIPDSKLSDVAAARQRLGLVFSELRQDGLNVVVELTPALVLQYAKTFPMAKRQLVQDARQHCRTQFPQVAIEDDGAHKFTFITPEAMAAFIGRMQILGVDLSSPLPSDDNSIKIPAQKTKEIANALGVKVADVLSPEQQAHRLLVKANLLQPVIFDGSDAAAQHIILEIPHTTEAEVNSALAPMNLGVNKPGLVQVDQNVRLSFSPAAFAKNADYFPNAKRVLSQEARTYYENKLNQDLLVVSQDKFRLTFETLDGKNKFVAHMKMLGLDLSNNPGHACAIILTDKQVNTIEKKLGIQPAQDMKTRHKKLAIEKLHSSIQGTVSEEREPNGDKPLKLKIQLTADTDATLFAEYLNSVIGLNHASVNGQHIILDQADFVKLVTLDQTADFKDAENAQTLKDVCNNLKAPIREQVISSFKRKVLEFSGLFEFKFTNDCRFYKGDNGEVFLGVECQSIEEANYFRTMLGIQDGEKNKMLYLNQDATTRLLNIDFADTQAFFFKQRHDGLNLLKSAAKDFTLRNGKEGDFILTIENPDQQAAFLAAAKGAGINLTINNNKIHITDKQYAALAEKLDSKSVPKKPVDAHVYLARLNQERSTKQSCHKLLCNSLTGKVAESDIQENGQPLISLGLKADIDTKLLIRNLKDIFGLQSARILDKEPSLLLSAADWHKLTILRKDQRFLFGDAALDKDFIALAEKLTSQDFEFVTALTSELFDKIYAYTDNENIELKPDFKMQTKGDINVIEIDCKTPEKANYFRAVLDINDGESGKMLYLDEAKFNALCKEKNQMTFGEIQTSYFDKQHPEVVPIKTAMEVGQLKNESSGFSLTVDDEEIQAAFLQAAATIDVELELTDDNKILISDKKYTQLAAPFVSEKLSFFPPESDRAHANCDVIDLCNCIDVTNSVLKEKQGKIELKLNKNVDKEAFSRFLRQRFGLNSAAAAESLDNSVELSKSDLVALLALPKKELFAKNKTLIDFLKPLQEKYNRAFANPLNLKKDKKNVPVPPDKNKKSSDQTSFEKSSKEKSVDPKMVDERLNSLDEWISDQPEIRSKVGTTGSPLAPTVRINDLADPAKSGQFVYDAKNGVVFAENENRRSEIYQAMLEVLDVGDDPVVDVNVSFDSRATPAEQAANLTVAAEAFAAALNADLLPVIDERCPFTQSQIVGKLTTADKAKYDLLNKQVKANKTLPTWQQEKLTDAELRKPVVVKDKKIEEPKVLAGDEPEKPGLR